MFVTFLVDIKDVNISLILVYKVRAFSPYHQGPNKGPIPNPKYSPFFPISKKNPNLKLKKRILPGSEFN